MIDPSLGDVFSGSKDAKAAKLGLILGVDLNPHMDLVGLYVDMADNPESRHHYLATHRQVNGILVDSFQVSRTYAALPKRSSTRTVARYPAHCLAPSPILRTRTVTTRTVGHSGSTVRLAERCYPAQPNSLAPSAIPDRRCDEKARALFALAPVLAPSAIPDRRCDTQSQLGGDIGDLPRTVGHSGSTLRLSVRLSRHGRCRNSHRRPFRIDAATAALEIERAVRAPLPSILIDEIAPF